jgi:DNA-binding LacI/PurR family transcriptional regulator
LPRPTALYCFNNTLAHFIGEEILQRGLQVPEDLSILGDGGEEVYGLMCLQVDWFQKGRTAMQMLLYAVTAPQKYTPEHRVLPHILCVGRTTAAPRSEH